MNANRLIKVSIAAVLVVLVSLTVREAIATTAVSYPDANTARWVAMGEYYTGQQAREGLRLERARAAEAARWNAMAGEALAAERSLSASAARWTALGQSYTALDAQEALNAERSRTASAARLEALAQSYLGHRSETGSRSQRSLDAETARWMALVEYYTK